MPNKTYRLRVPANTSPEKLKLTTYAVGFSAPSSVVGVPLQNGILDGYADYSVTLNEPASARTHFIIDTGLASGDSQGGFVEASFISNAASIAMSVSYPNDANYDLPIWEVAGQDNVTGNAFTLSNASRNPVTVKIILPENTAGAELVASNAGLVHWLSSDIDGQVSSVNFSGNSLSGESVDAVLAWASEAQVSAVDLTGANMSPPSSASCGVMDALANQGANVDHQAMLEPCPAYIRTSINQSGSLIYNLEDRDWPIMAGTTLSIVDGDLVADGPAADLLSIKDGNLIITAPLEALGSQ